jgi:AcrR family transcriptional regulator
MPSQRNPTRQRLISAAIELFASQGVTETTTKQIAELAGVNEVTLFRQFGTKHGLLLAAIENSTIFTHLGQTLIEQADRASSIDRALKDYATASLEALEAVPAIVRSVIGEAGQYPAENREALGRGLTQANRYVAEYLEAAIARGQLRANLSAEKLASLLNGMLIGYAAIEFTSEFHELWQNREDFLENLVALFLHGAVSPLSESTLPTTETVADLSANVVHAILRRAQKLGLQEYALAYMLFGSGLNAAEIIALERSHYISDAKEQLLRVARGKGRLVPVNQWILGKRYGSYKHNPLTQWLKSRKDSKPALFVNSDGKPMSETELHQQWQQLTAGLEPIAIEQAQQTWCVEMLMRGMSLENLSILTGWDVSQLQPYVRRVREKTALEQAIRLDRS